MESDGIKTWGIAIVGAGAGAMFGYFLFDLLVDQGFYALALPGAVIGWGASALRSRRNVGIGVFAAMIALLASVYAEWSASPFIADDSLAYFVTHLHQLRLPTMLMMALGVVFGYMFGVGRNKG